MKSRLEALLYDYLDQYQEEQGAIGYILLWLMGVPASLLFLVFIARGCT